jgi:GNAT superfamily N-acetyltransferase
MNTDGGPLFCGAALGERIERAEAQLMAAATEAATHRNADGRGFVIPVAGGVACFAEPDSPFNKVAGLGFDGVPSSAALDEIEHAYAACDAAVQVELAHLTDPELAGVLTGRGYQLVSFENVLGRRLAGAPDLVTPAGIEIRPSGDDEFGAWTDVIVDGFANADTQGVPSHEEFPREILDRALRDMAAVGGARYSALHDGILAGGASMRLTDGVAQLTGAATLPAHRRLGVQTALLTTRLADASATCDIAVITTQPASKSQQNAQRQGFHLLYTRAVLLKQP